MGSWGELEQMSGGVVEGWVRGQQGWGI